MKSRPAKLYPRKNCAEWPKSLVGTTGYLSGAGVLRFAQDDTLKNVILAAGTRQKTPLRPRALGAQDDTLKIEGARC